MNPRPRFDKLDEGKRQSILEIAAEEFGSHGFDGASFNRIIERAGISKGAAYYYFDDKVDLFETVLQAGLKKFEEFIEVSESEANTPELYWELVFQHSLTGISFWREHPWFARFARTLMTMASNRPDSPIVKKVMGTVEWKLNTFLVQGQKKGAIRKDLPIDLLSALLLGTGLAADKWFFERIDTFTDTEIEWWARINTDLIRRLLSPSEETL